MQRNGAPPSSTPTAMSRLSLHVQVLPNVCYGHLPKQAEFAVNPHADYLFLDGQPTDFVLCTLYGPRLHWHGPYCHQHDEAGYAAYRANELSRVTQMLALLTQAGYAPASALGQPQHRYNDLQWEYTTPPAAQRLPRGESYLNPIWLKKKPRAAAVPRRKKTATT
jgi:hypothetical protein